LSPCLRCGLQSAIMMPVAKRIGVILAAGRGRRMKSTKQLKLWPTSDGPKPLVCAAFDAICPICDAMVVVLGHAADSVAAALDDRKFHPVSSDPDRPMFDSIRAGLNAACEIDADATIVLQPGDHPEVAEATLNVLVDYSLKQPLRTVIPKYSGRGGHPVLIPPNVAKLILENACPDGLGQFWANHPELCDRIAIDDPSILKDIDTPADLAAN
jgi:molybdenum cofactor cytidylyltransferase